MTRRSSSWATPVQRQHRRKKSLTQHGARSGDESRRCTAMQSRLTCEPPHSEAQNNMPNLAAALKQEIARLARREARSLTRSLSRNSAQFRRDIAELKRQNAKAQAEIARLQRQLRQGSVAPPVPANGRKPRFSAASVKSQRRRLGVSAADYATLIGVTAHTIYKWEHGASKPRRAQLAALTSVRGLGKTEARRRLQAGAAAASRVRAGKG